MEFVPVAFEHYSHLGRVLCQCSKQFVSALCLTVLGVVPAEEGTKQVEHIPSLLPAFTKAIASFRFVYFTYC